MSSITYDQGALVVRTPYNPDFVYELKRYIPSSDRTFDKMHKVWRVAPQHGPEIVNLIRRCYGEMVLLPTVAKTVAQSEIRLLEVRYIGQCKDRGDGEQTAFGWERGEWRVIFPESVLKSWFGEPQEANQAHTLFGVLGVHEQAQPDEIKTAYRRAARQWHPDVCKEPDAAEQFKKIQAAYEILKDDGKRAKYLAGLKLERSMKVKVDYHLMTAAYRSPLRCGYILAEGIETLGRFKVTKIAGWEDVIDAQGRCLVTSWPMGADKFVEEWS
jgi:hypothetical protein